MINHFEYTDSFKITSEISNGYYTIQTNFYDYLIDESYLRKYTFLDKTYQDIIPLEAKLILRSLNSWDGQELDVHENPDKWPDYKASGETNGFVATKKAALKKMGLAIVWNGYTRYEFDL